MAKAETKEPQRTPFQFAQQLLSGLLRCWPHPPYEDCPSVLLCGPSGNGKGYVVQQAIHEAVREAQSSGDCDVVHVSPSLGPAMVVRRQDGSTGLRRILRQEIKKQCEEAAAGTHLKQTAYHTVVIVLDHMECFISSPEEDVSGSTLGVGEGKPSHAWGEEEASALPLHPALVTDLYTILRSCPPLLSESEATSLCVGRLVFVALFGDSADRLDPFLHARGFDVVAPLRTPTEHERRLYFSQFVNGNRAGDGVIPVALAEALTLRTGGITYGGLVEIQSLAEDALTRETDGLTTSVTDTTSGVSSHVQYRSAVAPLTFSNAIAAAYAQRVVQTFRMSGSCAALQHRENAGYVDVTHTRWTDIAGLAEVKQTLQRLVTRPLRHRDLYRAAGVRPSTGVLLYGPPGTGKTMLAKAMATELNASFVYLDLPQLMQSAVGSSERKLNEFFTVARERSPSVMFIDELQAAFGLRYIDGASHTAGTGTAHDARLVSHLLHLLDKAHTDEDHFMLFVGATNVLQLLDPLLLRAGRLDTHIEVPLPDTVSRESLVRNIVTGEWASWFADQGRNWDTNSKIATATIRDAQKALIDAFVDASEGMSGSELRNMTTVFASQLVRQLHTTFGDACQPSDVTSAFLRCFEWDVVNEKVSLCVEALSLLRKATPTQSRVSWVEDFPSIASSTYRIATAESEVRKDGTPLLFRSEPALMPDPVSAEHSLYVQSPHVNRWCSACSGRVVVTEGQRPPSLKETVTMNSDKLTRCMHSLLREGESKPGHLASASPRRSAPCTDGKRTLKASQTQRSPYFSEGLTQKGERHLSHSPATPRRRVERRTTSKMDRARSNLPFALSGSRSTPWDESPVRRGVCLSRVTTPTNYRQRALYAAAHANSIQFRAMSNRRRREAPPQWGYMNTPTPGVTIRPNNRPDADSWSVSATHSVDSLLDRARSHINGSTDSMTAYQEPDGDGLGLSEEQGGVLTPPGPSRPVPTCSSILGSTKAVAVDPEDSSDDVLLSLATWWNRLVDIYLSRTTGVVRLSCSSVTDAAEMGLSVYAASLGTSPFDFVLPAEIVLDALQTWLYMHPKAHQAATLHMTEVQNAPTFFTDETQRYRVYLRVGVTDSREGGKRMCTEKCLLSVCSAVRFHEFIDLYRQLVGTLDHVIDA